MGRNVETGESYDNGGGTPIDYVNRNELVEHWMFNEELFTGLTMYLILLDQIGCIFAKNDKIDKTHKSGIKYALSCFSDFSEEECEAIYALRCSMAHNFGLATEMQKKKAYKFTLSFDSGLSPAVCLSRKKWSGDYSDKSDETSTEIGVYALCDAIEDVVKNVYQSFDNGDLSLKVESTDEVASRFTLII